MNEKFPKNLKIIQKNDYKLPMKATINSKIKIKGKETKTKYGLDNLFDDFNEGIF